MIAVCGGGYVVFAAMSVRRFLAVDGHALADGEGPLPPVSILKPLHGDPVGLSDALETFVGQNGGGEVQYVFGMRGEDDPANGVVRGLQRRHPELDITCVVDPHVYGENRKISNLINIATVAKHDVLVISDADIIVAPGYLRHVVTALNGPGVGAVTCLYLGRAGVGIWSRLGAMGIDYQFMSNAIVGKTLGLANPCFGSTIALTRDTLTRIGSFDAFKDQLADDYEIGRAVRGLGLTVAMPPMTVTHRCDEPRWHGWIGHEIRWARTVRLIDPAGHAGSVITHPLPFALIAAALLGVSPISLALIFTVLGVRIAAKFAIDGATGARAGPWWLLPLRDMLSFGVFVASFLGSTVDWQGRRFRVSRDGVLTPL